MMFKEQEFRSPLKANPLRNPGESLDKQIHELYEDHLLWLAAFAVTFTGMAAVEWIRWYQVSPPSPVGFTIVAIGVWCFCIYRAIRLRKRIRSLKQGRDGEKAVGQYLDNLREQGMRVFHDIPGKNFNVDHLVIAPQGIYVIETKTLSKPVKGKPEIHIREGQVYANGQPIKRNPLTQAHATASWVQELLQETTGKTFPVRPVILFPGWYVHPYKNRDAWVLNPKAFPSFVAASPPNLSHEDIQLAAYHLSRYIRVQE